MRVLLVDDEDLALERLAFAFQDVPDVEIVGTAHDGDEAAAQIAALQPDLVILDVQMPGRTGLSVAAALPDAHRPEIVFLTAFEHYAPDAFDVEAADYLLKPVRFDRLRLAVDRARRRRALKAAAAKTDELERTVAALAPAGALPAAGTLCEFWAPTRDGAVRVPIADVDWIEAAGDYVLLHTRLRSHMVRARMSELERRLDPAVMLRAHRSAFVRLDAVERIVRPARNHVEAVLKDGAQIPVGPSYAAVLLAALGLD